MADDAEFQMESDKYGPWWGEWPWDSGTVSAVPIYFTPEDAAEWDRFHDNRSGFVEALAASHFVKQGYHVLRDFCTTDLNVVPKDGLRWHSTHLLHQVVGPEVSLFLREQMAADNPLGYGEPDLFVFCEPRPNDPKVHFPDEREWFFAEVKGPGDKVRENQRLFWSRLAAAFGPDLVRLVRVAPAGTSPSLEDVPL